MLRQRKALREFNVTVSQLKLCMYVLLLVEEEEEGTPVISSIALDLA